MDKLVIIDGNSLINRAFYALPLLSNKDGEFSNAVYGFCTMLIKTIEEHKPTHLVVAFDYGKKTFRHDLYKEYKGTRKETPSELKSQFPILKKVLQSMGITMIEKEGIEADDIIGTIASHTDKPTIIVTGDKDALQLIDKSTTVWLTKKGISEVEIVDEKALKEKYNLKPSQIIELKALMGDNSDNIPGVLGVGEKTAMTLLEKYNDIDNLYANIDKISGKLQEKLIQGKDMAYLSKNLATINKNVDIKYDIEKCTYQYPFNEQVLEIFRQYQFNSLLKREELFNNGIEKYKKINIKQIIVDNNFILPQNAKRFAILLDNEISFAFDEKVVYKCQEGDLLNKGCDYQLLLQKLSELLEDKNIKKTLYDSKNLMHQLIKYKIDVEGIDFDCSIASYLTRAGDRNLKYTELLDEYGLDSENGASNLFLLQDKLQEDLNKYQLNELYRKIELPLIPVLFDMEKTGFKIDIDVLNNLSEKYDAEIEDIKKIIYLFAGEEFNINSPKQLGEILFDKLGLVAYNNKKKSTSIEILEELVDKHPIIALIIRYRKIQKLKTTYVDAYKVLLNKENRIHTIFNQTLTATGRLSSSEPNLQNIPVRDDEGKELRKMFVPTNKDGYIVSADYSQIELRLLANFSRDPILVNSFKNNEDIHTRTASEVFNVPFNEVTPTQRRAAKAVNFGIIYGISDYGLAQNVGCTRKEAKNYIDVYFEKYPLVKQYMNKNIELAKEKGYSTTMFGRIRKINELFSTNYITRTFGERASMNMPLQGSASDIIKIAMIKVYNRLLKEGLKSKLILQIHDELIIDATKDECEYIKKILKEEMEKAVDLPVKLTVDVNSGKDWFDCK